MTPPVPPRRQALAPLHPSSLAQAALASPRPVAPPAPHGASCPSSPPPRQPASRRQASPPPTIASRPTKRCRAPTRSRSPPASAPPCISLPLLPPTLPQPPTPRHKHPIRREEPTYSSAYRPPSTPFPQTHDPVASRPPLARVRAGCPPPRPSSFPPFPSTGCRTCCPVRSCHSRSTPHLPRHLSTGRRRCRASSTSSTTRPASRLATRLASRRRARMALRPASRLASTRGLRRAGWQVMLSEGYCEAWQGRAWARACGGAWGRAWRGAWRRPWVGAAAPASVRLHQAWLRRQATLVRRR